MENKAPGNVLEEGHLEPSQQDIPCPAVTPDFVPAPHV